MLSHLYVIVKFQKIMERKSKPPTRCKTLYFFGGNRGSIIAAEQLFQLDNVTLAVKYHPRRCSCPCAAMLGVMA